MADFYRERFGVDSEVLFGPADSLGELMVDSPAPGPPARLVYFGSIWAWQRDALARLVANLEAVNATLDLYVFHELPTDIQSARVFARNPVPASEVMCRIRQYDGVVIPASFADAERHLTQLNIATKLSESYASGTVPVIIAPPFAAMTQFANRHGGAIVVSDFSDPTQVARLRQIKSRDFRAQLLPLARRVSETECSTAVMRRRWSSVWGAADPAYAGNTDSGRSR